MTVIELNFRIFADLFFLNLLEKLSHCLDFSF